MKVTYHVCITCRQCPAEMKPVPEGGRGSYRPDKEELARNPFPAWEGTSHEEFVCQCGIRHNWYSLVPSEEEVVMLSATSTSGS